MTFKAIVHPAEEGGFWAEIPALPGCMSEGETLEELRANLLEAIEGWTEAATEQARLQLSGTSFEFALAA